MKKSDLMLKDVIDINRGKKLGFIDDVDIDLANGKIKALIIPAHPNKIMSFFSKQKNMVIKWGDIKTIGEDVILVNASEI